jgi:hypothetical protein
MDNDNHNVILSDHQTGTTTTTSTMDYQTQQQKQLLIYHLRKYTAALNATLVFVTTDMMSSSSVVEHATTTNTSGVDLKQPTVNVRELPWIWKALANGQAIWNYNTMDAIETGRNIHSGTMTESKPVEENTDRTDVIKTNTTTSDSNNNDNNITNTGIYSLIYGPDNHNSEWIESVLVRNANYVGHWDAMTDSIWKILIPSSSSTTIQTMDTNNKLKLMNDETKITNGGDELWLQELYDSIVPVMMTSTTASSSNTLQTPPPNKSSSSSSTNSNAPPSSSLSKSKATPNDAAVSSFFEDLLK